MLLIAERQNVLNANAFALSKLLKAIWFSLKLQEKILVCATQIC